MSHDIHHEESFIRKWIFSVDHKIIGLQYLFTSMFFLLFGFCLVLLIRWQLAYPGEPFPIIGSWLTTAFAPGGVITPASYNALGAMHGTIMIFLGIVPLSVGAFGNYFLPLQIGAKDMAFPVINMLSYWNYFIGGVLMLLSFILPGGAAQSGWTSYVPLSVLSPGQTVWLIAMTFIITSSLLGSINFLVTTINLRAPGMTWSRLPLFVWSQFVTALLLLFAFPVLQGGAILQLLDRVLHTSFFIPKDLVVGGTPIDRAGGGSALLWQHLFWFLAHPEVYVLLLPSMGIVSDILANGTRKPIFGYKEIAGSFCFIAVLSFVVWAHHMFISGMKTSLSYLFMTTTLIISVPSVAILTCFLLSLKGASIRFTVPMLFALAFLPMFGIGGLTGLPLGFTPTDVYLHDTYYVIGHFHYIVVAGTIIALMGGIYYWFPKMFGRKMNQQWSKIHFWGTIVLMNGIFFPMFIQGLAGVQRRLYDPTVQLHNQVVQPTNVFMTYCAFGLLLFQIPFLLNFAISLFKGEKTEENPWQATTLEWACPSPPLPHRNFEKEPVVHRGPYEYSVPGHPKDFLPQWTE
jgi:cytochrome c oxidase subunit 1